MAERGKEEREKGQRVEVVCEGEREFARDSEKSGGKREGGSLSKGVQGTL